MRVKQIFIFALAISFAMLLQSESDASAQTPSSEPKNVTLLKRKKIDGVDNYNQAAFSFRYGINGDAGREVTSNNWDLLFGNSPIPDAFDVTMVTDDCSRIQDLGGFNWSDAFQVPALSAHPVPTREPSARAIVGHMYVVHSKDRDTDHYALFRVEALVPGTSVTISWKLIPPSDESPGVMAAAAPATYPAIAQAANAQGEVVIEVQVDPEGNVLSTKLMSGHPLLEVVSSEAAKQWKFSSLQGSTRARAVRLTFGYRTVDKGPIKTKGFTTVFMPPYKVEVQAHAIIVN